MKTKPGGRAETPLLDQPAPPGAALFLDPREGWLWQAAEAAGSRESLYEPAQWPRRPRRDLPGALAASGLTFVWAQEPEPGGETARLLAAHLAATEGRLLVVGDAPADLEPLAALPGVLFLNPPGGLPPDGPLAGIALEALCERERAEGARRLAAARARLAALKGEEAALKARLADWADLDGLESRFQAMGRETENLSRKWEEVRAEAETRRAAWSRAARKAESLLRRLSLGAKQKSATALKALEAAESEVQAARLEEEKTFAEARRLKERLTNLRRQAENWPGREALAENAARLAGESKLAAELLALETSRPGPDPEKFLAEAPLILTFTALERLAGRRYPAVLRLASRPPGAKGRQELAALAARAERQLVVLGDFTFWPVWGGPVPKSRLAGPAWLGLKVAEEESELKEFLARGGLFKPLRPWPAPAPRLARLAWPEGAPFGLGLRALGEIGPANPVSALAAVRAAFSFARSRGLSSGPAVFILTASPAQARLAALMAQDLKIPPGLILAGEPQDFHGHPKAPLVILEPAFESPHLSHPWAWPSFGRWRLPPAWGLAGEEIWLAGREDWLKRLPPAAPLTALWRAAEEAAPPAATLDDPEPFQRALEKAEREIQIFMPAPEPAWWPSWEGLFLAAARRRIKLVVFSAPPDSAPAYAAAALKTLGSAGALTGLASGFPGFLALVDRRHLAWGRLEPDLSILASQTLPLAAAFLAQIMQLELAAEKIGRGGGGLKLCRRCGWPLQLVNQGQLRGLADEQPLKISCLGQGCVHRKGVRLDERPPFASPPVCGLNRRIRYRRRREGRQEIWACPDHGGSARCPAYRVIPGDCPEEPSGDER